MHRTLEVEMCGERCQVVGVTRSVKGTRLPGAKITQIKELTPATLAKAKKWKWLLRPLEQFGSRSKLGPPFSTYGSDQFAFRLPY